MSLKPPDGANTNFNTSGVPSDIEDLNNKVPYASVKNSIGILDGAAGDGVTDDTAIIQAWIDWAEANLDITRVVFFPAGNYLVSGITATYVTLLGEQGSRAITGVATLATELGTRLIHKAGSTTPLITMAGSTTSLGWDRVQNFTLQGKQNQNLAVTRKPILSSADRRHFFVSVANAPATPSNAGDFPGYGVCVFYDANGYRLGTGIVSTVNAGTGEITLFDGTDNYTGIAAPGTGLLTSTEQVAFAPITTYTADGITLTSVSDSCMLSPPGILIAGRCKVVRDVYIRDFHCGVVNSDSTANIDNLWTNNCGMAGVAMRTMGAGADMSGKHWFIQGGGFPDTGQAAASIPKEDDDGNWNLCALWGLPSYSYLSDIVCDEGYHGVIDKGGAGMSFDTLFVDKPLKEAIISWSGTWNAGTGNPTVKIDLLIARTVGQALTSPAVLNFPTHSRAVIGIRGGNQRKFQIDTCTVARYDSASLPADDFDVVSNIYEVATNGKHEIFIGSIPYRQAAVALETGVATFQSTSVLIPPKVTTAERDASNFPVGSVLYNLDRAQLQLYTSGGGLGAVSIARSLYGAVAWDPGSLIVGASESKDVTVTSAAVGDPASAGLTGIAAVGWKIEAVVTAANTVTVTITNNTAGTVNLPNGTVRAVVEKWV